MFDIRKLGVLAVIALASSQALGQEVKKTAPEAPPAADGLPITLTYKDGIQFKTDDGAFQATIGGRVIENYRYISDRPDDTLPRTNPDSFFLRQARIDVNGKAFRQFDFRLQLDFPTGQPTIATPAPSAATGTIQDAYLGWSGTPEVNVKVGQFKEPFSQEQTTSLRATDFVERSVLDRLAPARDLGASVSGKLGGGFFEYEVGAFNGSGRGVADANDEKDLAGRIRFSPFEGFRIGVAGTAGDVDNASLNGLDLITTELGVVFNDVAPATGTIDGLRTRLGAELTWIVGPFGLRAEVAQRTDTIKLAAAPTVEEEVDLKAWSVSATWLLTGEKKVLENRIVPNSPFDPSAGGWGAFELAVRIASLEIDDSLAGIVPAGNSDAVRTFTAGLNWYLTRNVRISPNFIVEKYDDEITFAGTGRTEDSLWGALVRFQIDF